LTEETHHVAFSLLTGATVAENVERDRLWQLHGQRRPVAIDGRHRFDSRRGTCVSGMMA